MKRDIVADSIPGADCTITAPSVATGIDPVAQASSAVDVVSEPIGAGDSAPDPALHDLKRKTARGALISAFGQGASLFFRMGSMVVMARLLVPEDFGLVGMITACTGFLGLFRDAGLSMATVQRASITRAQTSMLFWINLAVGGLLAVLSAAIAPILVAFYHEPRLLWATIVLGLSFVFNGAAAQHRAVLQRDMRFAVLAFVDIVALLVSIAVGVGIAIAGQGYWALVGMTLSVHAVSFVGVWIAGAWVPDLPRRGAQVWSMLSYGGTVTLNSVIVYLAYNTDKVLLGRFWGAATLGIYGRAYQLINLPTENLNTTIGQVAFPALSRLQNNPERLRNYFLKGYGLFLSLVMPITLGCGLFADDIIRVFLGAKWDAAVPVFRLLAPTIFTFALINPLAWLLLATGRAKRSLMISLVLAPVVMLSYAAGLRFGPNGVAAGFSAGTMLLAVPVIIWATRDTAITAIDTLKEIMRPFLSIAFGAGAALAAGGLTGLIASPLLRLVAENSILFGVYAIVLLFVMGQKTIYLGLLREIGVWPFTGRGRLEGSLKTADA
jgi:O-antigen/teichoic acid export membrane protein